MVRAALLDELEVAPPSAGQVCAVAAQPGVGKSTFLTRLALDTLVRGGQVVHVALDRSVDDVHLRYDTLLSALWPVETSAERDQQRADLARRRAVQVLPAAEHDTDRLQALLDASRTHLHIQPGLVIVDGLGWDQLAGASADLRRIAQQRGFVLWAAARTDEFVPEESGPFDLVVALEPDGALLRARVWPPPAGSRGSPRLDPGTLRRIEPGGRPGLLVPSACTLLSGAAPGAEAEFGACAERWGVAERNLTFAGRRTSRTRGLQVLGPEELRQGEVSRTYLEARLHRRFRSDPAFDKVLQTIWHQVNPAGCVYAVGVIKQDGTVKGGTGWAVELAKQLGKPAFVFDQPRGDWYRWVARCWQPIDPPVIQMPRFAGTGTRRLDDSGRAAIRALFERSFELPG